MKTIGFVVTFLFMTASIAYGQHAEGTYTTYLSGRPVLTESYTVSTLADGTIKEEASLTKVGLGAAQKLTITVTSGYKPIRYSVEAGPTTLSAELDGSTAKITLTGQPDRVVSTNATALLENSIWSPYIFLFRQYDTSKGGRQSFSAFSPAVGKNLSVSIERTGASEGVAPPAVGTESYLITLAEKVQIQAWTDRGRNPLVFAIPSQSIKVVRNGSEALADSVLKDPLAPKAKASFSSEDVTFKNGALQLAGTLTIPKVGTGPFPAVVLITGSGLQDRDNNPGGFDLFRLIAERLSAKGIAVLRHDDRGFGMSAAPTGPTSYRDLINDTKAAVEYLRSRKEIDPEHIGLIGHSEGAETAGILAEADSRIAAIVLLSGVAHPLDAVLLEQALYVEALKRPLDPSSQAELPEEVRGLIRWFADAKAGKPDRSVSDAYEWCRQHAAHDPLSTIRMVKCPILILQGERDENALSYNGVALALAAAQAGNKHVMLRIFPDLNHLYVASALDKTANAEQRGHVSEEVLDTLEKWAVGTLAVPKKEAELKNQSREGR